MITEDGFIKHDDFVEMAKNAPIVEIICPNCKEMTRTEDLGRERWYCYECESIFHTPVN